MSEERTPDSAQGNGDTQRGASSPHAILFPSDVLIWNEARKLAADRNVRVEDLSTIALQDPSIVIELIKTANALYFAVGKAPITSIKTAIIRLGQDVVRDILDKMKDRPKFESADVKTQFELQRSRCKRTSIIARLIAELVTKTLGDDCQTAGLFCAAGEMLAVAHLKEHYVNLVQSVPRASMVYRLAQDFRFDVEKMGLVYLRKHGLPEVLLFAIDRDARPPSQDRAIMRPICQAALELVDAFDSQKWEKFAPGKTLAPKSATRGLQIPEAQYLKLYEKASEYLFSAKLLEEKLKLKREATSFDQGVPQVSEGEPKGGNDGLDSELSRLLSSSQEVTPVAAAPARDSAPEATKIHTVQEPMGDVIEQFALNKTARSSVPRVSPSEAPVEPEVIKPVSNRAAKAVADIEAMFDDAGTSEDLLSKLLEMMVTTGGFEKSALIVISRSRTRAIVVAARGPNIGNGQRLDITDPLSPLAKCFSKVQSWGNKESEHSPFGSKAFALSPIDVDHDTPVALYADCGNKASITFENRRVFRTVVEILNRKLPQVPGGIPVELQE